MVLDLLRGAFLAALLCFPALAGPGHDHGSVQRSINVSPRTEFRNANHEGVLIHEGGRLILFLQRFTDGTPLAEAEVEATVNFIGEEMEEIAPGVYAAEVELTAGRNEIELGYMLGENVHAVTASLTMPGRATASARSTAPSRSFAIPPYVLVGIAAALYAAISLLLIFRSGRQSSPARSV